MEVAAVVVDVDVYKSPYGRLKEWYEGGRPMEVIVTNVSKLVYNIYNSITHLGDEINLLI